MWIIQWKGSQEAKIWKKAPIEPKNGAIQIKLKICILHQKSVENSMKRIPRARNFKKSSYGTKKWSHSNLAENLHTASTKCGEFNEMYPKSQKFQENKKVACFKPWKRK